MEELQLKNLIWFIVASARASRVFPVPGGPKRSTPFHGSLMPVKNSGMIRGRVTASCSSRLASFRLAMLSKVTPRLFWITSLSTISVSLGSSPTYLVGAPPAILSFASGSETLAGPYTRGIRQPG